MSLPPREKDLIGIINSLERQLDDVQFIISKQNFTTQAGIIGQTGPQGLTGSTGPQGPAGTITIGTVTTGAVGSSASVTNAGTSTSAVLNFSIPRGDTGAKGDKGDAGTLTVGTVTTTASGTNATVTNVSVDPSAAVLNFTIPRGDKGTPANRILNGTTAPNFSIGDDGDFYLDTTAGVMYGPKSGGTWPASSFVSTPGPAGPAGSPSVTDARLFYLY